MDIDARNRETADRCIEAAWLHRCLHDAKAYFDAQNFVFRLPALCEFVPINDETWKQVESQQRLLVAAELIKACRRLGWSAHLVDDDSSDYAGWGWAEFVKFSGISVEVDYSHYGVGDDDPNEPSHFMMGVRLRLAVKAAHCGLHVSHDAVLDE